MTGGGGGGRQGGTPLVITQEECLVLLRHLLFSILFTYDNRLPVSVFKKFNKYAVLAKKKKIVYQYFLRVLLSKKCPPKTLSKQMLCTKSVCINTVVRAL